MDTNDKQDFQSEEVQNWEKAQKRGKFLGGFVLLAAGALLLAREMGMELPNWLFTWKFLLIVIGLVIGIKHGFRKASWLVLVLIGSTFLFMDFYPGMLNRAIIWPVVLMVLGLFVMLKPHRRGPFGNRHGCKKKWRMNLDSPDGPHFRDSPPHLDSTLELNAFMSGIQKSVVSKDFREGEITAVLGGIQLDMSHSDITDKARLEINAFLGGIKLIVPAHWEVKSEINCVAGGVEDKRKIISVTENSDRKLLVLEGNVFMGGIEIRNF